jgi:uncharacterized protein (DUF2062 family)
MKKLSRSSISYYYIKLVKQKGTPDYISRGVAIGLFVGFFVPFLGQMIAAFMLAMIFKAAKVPALACTWVTNYFSIPIIYPIQCFVGSYLIGNPFSYEQIKALFVDFIKKPGFDTFSALGTDIALAFFAGGLLFGSISALIGYYLSMRLINRHRQKVKQRKKEKERRHRRLHAHTNH